MKTIFLCLTFFLTSSFLMADDFFRNDQGMRVPLKPRYDKLAVILKYEMPEQEINSRLSGFLSAGDNLGKVSGDLCMIDFAEKKSETELANLLQQISSMESFVKRAVKVYKGTSVRSSAIPSDRLIVKLRNLSDAERMEVLNVVHGCVVSGNVNGERGFLLRLGPNAALNSLDLAEVYFQTGLFEYVQPDFIYPNGCLLQSIPNDQYFPSQWALNNTGQLIQTGSTFYFFGDESSTNGIADADMDLPEAWALTTGSPSIKIGIIDSGIDSAHADLQSPGHILPGFDAFSNREGSSVDYFNHGTSVAGIIGAVRNNSIGIAGIAPDCRLMSVCIFDVNGTTSTSVITRAFDTAVARGLDVLNNSWGGGLPEPAITDAVNNAALNGRGGLGCAVLFASGNDGRNPPIYPSTLANVISVGASTTHDQKKSPGNGNYFFWGSNYGEDSSGDMDVIAPTSCYTLKIGGYDPYFWGTSASCPNASGVAALALSANPSLTRQQLYSSILRSCEKTDNIPYETDKPYGKWNAYNGYGRVNAFKAVMLALGTDVVGPSIAHENIPSSSSTYPSTITAVITDHDGSSVPVSGPNSPRLIFRIRKNGGNWSAFDSAASYSVSGNAFSFRSPSVGWETEVQYYIKAYDAAGNSSTFPAHAPDPFWLCYYAVGSITHESKKFSPFSGVDYGGTVSPYLPFGSFRILDANLRIYMRHTYLEQEVIQVYSPDQDENNNRKCLFSTNGESGDNITGALVTDTAGMFWNQSQPPFTNGVFMPDYNLRGLRGQNAYGNWRIIHFDGGIGDYAFFDSIRISLWKTTGTKSACARLKDPSDSVLLFENAVFPNVYEKNFYLKNSGTVNLNLAGTSFSGSVSNMYSLVNTPPATIVPNDSALFRVRLNTQAGSSGPVQGAVLNIQTNDPSKPVFKVSLQTSDSLFTGLKNLQLSVLAEGLYDSLTSVSVRDTFRVYLRWAQAPYQIVDSSSSVVGSDGRGSFNFRNAQLQQPYYITVKHRNSILTWSAVPVTFTGYQASYDFTQSQSAAYGSNLVRKGIKYCLYTGDIDLDGVIDTQDLGLADNAALSFSTGYLPEDLNGDSFVDLEDLQIAGMNSSRFVIVISP